MRIEDEVYGAFDIQEDILIELIHSVPIQRLKGVHQGGASYLVNPNWNVTRYEHSIGVMLLIRQLGGSVEEQAAGLLHDVSHTAFSHVIDFVLDYKNQDYHEEIFEQVISRSSIPDIFKKYGYEAKLILDETKWKILEQPLPDLCADRIDYTLRDMYHQGMMPQGEMEQFLKALRFNGEKVYVKDESAAEWFVHYFYKEVIDYFLHPLNVYGYQVLAQTLKESMKRGIVSKEDFLLTDESLLQKVRGAEDVGIKRLLHQLHPQVKVEHNEEEYDYSQHGKLRYIDPLIKTTDGELVPISEVNAFVHELTERARERSDRGTYVKVINGSHNE